MNEEQLHIQLKKYFSYDSFRPGQLDIIQSILQQQDTLAVLPTGTGKSVCYQLPALIQEGMTIIVSPLISLMIDQVKQLKAKQIKDVVALSSFMNIQEKRHVFSKISSYKMIFISPEMMQQQSVISMFKKLHVSLFVIDEAHCISQWGHAFRPDYLRLQSVIHDLGNPPLLALTATAPPEVQNDICHALHRPHMTRLIYPMDRPNIGLFVKKAETEEEKNDYLLQTVTTYDIPTLIYFSSRKQAEKMAKELAEALPDRRIAFYHGEMAQEDRIVVQQQFMNDQIDLVCCTSAFGMGINKGNIRLVIHYHFPGQLEAFIQEIGRAGRDGEKSISLVFDTPFDASLPLYFMEQELPSKDVIDSVVQAFHTKEVIYFQKEKELELQLAFDINEIQWRFLLYQLEIHGMMKENMIYPVSNIDNIRLSIQKNRVKRFMQQKEKLNDAQVWISGKDCFRQRLYTHFQDTFERVHSLCCSHCDGDEVNWGFEPSIKRERTEQSWKRKLYELLSLGGTHESTRAN